MAKYITLDGLSTFLGKLKDGSYKATGTSFGAVKVVGNRSSSITTVGTSATANRSYGIELDSNGKAFVNVPWTEPYEIGTGLVTYGHRYIHVKYDNKTLFAGNSAKDTFSSITDSYDGHPLQLGKDHKWKNTGDNLSNLNNFVEYGVYNIFGEHTRNDDNLPIMNTGGGHTFQGRLLVYDSSLSNTGNGGDDCCITQVLTLSNRVGGDGNTYIRTATGRTSAELTWGTWGKLQTNVEVGQIPEQYSEALIDNGIYSGVMTYSIGTTKAVIKYNNAYFYHAKTNKDGNTYTFIFSYHSGNPNMSGCSLSYFSSSSNPQGAAIPTYMLLSGSAGDTTIISEFEVHTYLNNTNLPLLTTSSDPAITFVLITVNGYAAAAQAGVPTQCTQLLYGISVGGTVVLKKRIGVKGGDVFHFGPWEDLGGSGGGLTEIPTASNTTLGGIKVVGNRSSSIATVGTSSTTGRYYGIELDSNNKAFVNVPWKEYTLSTATTTDFGGIKIAAAPRASAITTTQGGTTADRYYGVEVDINGKAFVNVPWTASSTATASTTALAVTYKTLSSGGATISSLTKDTITRISTSTIAALTAVTGTLTISRFATKNSNKLTTYGLQFLVGTSGSPKLVVPSSVKWANGIAPILNGGEIIDIIFTTLDGSIYTATWTKYF